MGSGASSSNERQSRQFNLLIGNLKNKTGIEKKLFGLSSLVQPERTRTLSKNSHERNNEKVETLVEEELFVPLYREKSLICTQTYTSWRARNDLVKFTQRLGFKKKVIYFLPIDSVPDFVSNFNFPKSGLKERFSLFSLIGTYIETFYSGMNVKWLDPVYITQTKWKIRKRSHKKTSKEQYLVSDFYRPLQKMMPKDGYCIMGLSWTDLYPKEELNFVLGEANYMTSSGVMSFGRFEPKTFDADNVKDISSIDADLMWKLLKVSSHELGHLFGLEHCEFFHCLMNGSNSIQEALSQPSFLCPVCLRKIQHVCKFDITQRYETLLSFFEDLNEEMPSEKWTSNVTWLKKCLHFLKSTDTSYM
ncbi:hypothetical protein FSP39_021827 [Pinctada imbricata]|uniref:Archaemetzincin-2 n=1 Tax=Pinctada imbricata TaxID=66713 RepID=A0AA88YEC4_PINIB|nr:hypothetical protein FSP39_021827 [Pinctada imbricata]